MTYAGDLTNIRTFIRQGKLALTALLLCLLLWPSIEVHASNRVKIRIQRSDGAPLPGLTIKASSKSTEKTQKKLTNNQGLAVFRLNSGSWRFRTTYLGYRYSSKTAAIPGKRLIAIVIPHRPVVIRVQSAFPGVQTLRPGLPISISHPVTGAVIAGPSLSDDQGAALFLLPVKSYVAKTSYLGRSWSSDPFSGQDAAISIPSGKVVVTVRHGAVSMPGAHLSFVSSSGTVLEEGFKTDENGRLIIYPPPGWYRWRMEHDGSGRETNLLHVQAGIQTAVELQAIAGHEPAMKLIQPPAQTRDGSDAVLITLALSDADGDPCRLRIEHSLDGAVWRPAHVAPVNGQPAVDNNAFFQIGSPLPLKTSPVDKTWQFHWLAGEDLPHLDIVRPQLRFTLSDGANFVYFHLPSESWLGFGHDLSGSGLSATESSSHGASLAVDVNGYPHIAWIESSPDGYAVAYLRWDGSRWVDADGHGRESMIISRPFFYISEVSLALDSCRRPRMVWNATDSELKALYYLAWNGSAWLGSDGKTGNAGPDIALPGDILGPKLFIDEGDGCHLLFNERDATGQHLCYLKLSAGEWLDADGLDRLHPRSASATFFSGYDLGFDGSSIPHLVWAQFQSGAGASIHHRRLISGEWRSLGADPIQAAVGSNISVEIFLRGDAPTVFFTETTYILGTLRETTWLGDSWSGAGALAGGFYESLSARLLPSGDAALVAVGHGGGRRQTSLFLLKNNQWSRQSNVDMSEILPGGDFLVKGASLNDSGEPIIALEAYDKFGYEIYCLRLRQGMPALDLAPPIPPGGLSLATTSLPYQVTLAFGTPAQETHFYGYIIEAAMDQEGREIVATLDSSRQPALAAIDFAGTESIVMDNLTGGDSLYFRLAARDQAGHLGLSPFTGPITVPSDTTAPLLIVERPLPEQTTPDTFIEVRGWVDDPSAEVFINGTSATLTEGRFSIKVNLSEGENILRLSARDSLGNESLLQLPVISIPFTITSPPPGMPIRGRIFQLQGSCGGSVAAIGAKSSTTIPNEGRYQFDVWGLDPGMNTVTVWAGDRHGRKAERQYMIRSTGEDRLISVSADPAAGGAPLTVTLTAHAQGLENGAICRWDKDGNGTIDSQGPSLITVKATYAGAGVFHPVFTLTDIYGIIYESRGTVVVNRAAVFIGSLPLRSPHSIAIGSDGALYVSETAGNAVSIIGPDLALRKTLTCAGEEDPLLAPAGLALDGSGTLWVSDRGQSRLVAYGQDGGYLGSYPTFPLEFIAIVDRLLYGSMPSSSELFAYNLDVDRGRPPLSVRCRQNLAPLYPQTMFPDDDGNLYILDGANGKLTKFRATGAFGDGSLVDSALPVLIGGSLPWIFNLSLDDTLVAVADKNSAGLVIFSHNGRTAFSIPASLIPSPPLANPKGMALRRDIRGTLIYIADTGNNRLLAYLLPDADPLQPIRELTAAMRSGDIEAAAAAAHSDKQDEIRRFLEELGDSRIEAADWFDGAQWVGVRGDTARLKVIKRLTLGEITDDFEFELRLLKDENGDWKIFDF